MKKKKKLARLLPLLSAALLFLTPALPARADVIWEPDNSFYTSHQNECEYIDRQYTADGNTSLYKEPSAKKASDTLEAGTSVYISFLYRDKQGVEWGYADQFDTNKSGWARMSELSLVYDSREFIKDHESELDSDASETLKTGSSFYSWSYPESGQENTHLTTLDSDLTFSTTYTDSSGRLWGYCAYWRGNRDFWVCLSDPENPDIPASEPPHVTETPTPSMSVRSSISWPLVVLPVAGVIILTCILLKIFWKKKN